MCYGICTAESDDGTDDIDALKREGLTDEEEEDEEEEEEERQRVAELEGPEEGENEEEEEDLGEKDPEEKKTD